MHRRTHCSCWFIDTYMIDRNIDDLLALMAHQIAVFRDAPTNHLSFITHHEVIHQNHERIL